MSPASEYRTRIVGLLCLLVFVLVLAESAVGDTPRVTDRFPALVAGNLIDVLGVKTRFSGSDRVCALTADRLSVSRSRALGPFRFGFLRSVRAHGVEVVLRADDRALAEDVLAPATDAIVEQISRRLGGVVSEVSVEELRIVLANDCGNRRPFLVAERCTAKRGKLSCDNGRIVGDSGALSFRNGVFGAGSGQLVQSSGAGISVDLWMLASIRKANGQ